IPRKLPRRRQNQNPPGRRRRPPRPRRRGLAGGEDSGPCCGRRRGNQDPAPDNAFMLTDTAILPTLLCMGDYFSAFIARNPIMGNLGHRLGIDPSPKKRVISFYEKHDPEKLNEVTNILSKHYGDYPKLVKRLERKYGDYGYFLNWEDDETPMNLAFEKLWETQELVATQFDTHAGEEHVP
ncbi:hypothetical protein ACHAWF_012513, partial [Thalassiosira exigua]